MEGVPRTGMFVVHAHAGCSFVLLLFTRVERTNRGQWRTMEDNRGQTEDSDLSDRGQTEDKHKTNRGQKIKAL